MELKLKNLKKSKLESQLDRQSYAKKIINVDKPQEVQRTNRKSSRSRRWREKYATAAHEAAHAVTTIALGGQLKNRGIVLREDGGITYVQHPVLRRRNSANQWEYHPGSMRQVCRARLVSAFAGPIAENRISNDQTGIMGDVRNAVMNLRILFQGNDHLVEACNFKKYSLQFAIVMHLLVLTPSIEGAMEALDIVNGRELIDQKIVRMLVRSARCAHLIVERNWPTIEKLATALLPKSSMTGREIEEIVCKELHRDPISRRTSLKVLQFVKQKNQVADS